MQKIDITVNKGKILNYQVILHDDLPTVHASIGLYAFDKKIADFGLSTSSWGGSMQFDLPPEMIGPILLIAQQLEVILTRECNAQLCLIEIKPE